MYLQQLMKKQKLRIIKYSSQKKLIQDGWVQKLFELLNDSYSHLYGFTPLTQAQIDAENARDWPGVCADIGRVEARATTE